MTRQKEKATGLRPVTFNDEQSRPNSPFAVIIAQLARKAQAAIPGANGRVERAVDLVLAGAVTLRDDGAATVASQSSNETYTVNGRCTCKDAQYRAPGGWCKHRIAWALTVRAWEERAKELAERNGWTVEVLGNRLIHVLCGGLRAGLVDEVTNLFWATERIKAQAVGASASEPEPEQLCGCYLDSQTCPVCLAAAREAYGVEIPY